MTATLILATTWDNLFGFEHDLTIMEKLIRTVVVYLFLIVGLRLAGKRELAQLNAFDLVVLLVLSNAVQNAIIGHDETLMGGLIGAATLLAVNAIFVRFLYKHEKLDRLIEGSPQNLIENGKVVESALARELITHSELEIAAHKQGFASLDEIDQAILEPGGTVAFIPKKPAPEEQRFDEVMRQLQQISGDLAALR